MKNNKLFLPMFLMGLTLSCFMSPVIGQTHKCKPQKQDTTKMKDPINRMHDSTKLRQMMRDSNVMKDHHKMKQDSMPVKRGWLDVDSTLKKKIRI